jgi:phospholipid/cholesterol/gamma-HCH transport system substrate-binding protein
VRRLAGIGVLLAAAVVALVTLGLSGTSGNYRVDAIFDNADYLIPGQDVKIAGARVGQVEKVKLTRERKARVQMRIDPGFAPFRANASCSIRPQSLIGEKFVECDPGDTAAGPLARHGGGAPTVAVAHTHSPVDLDLVFATLRLPLRQRLSIVVNELGAGLVGRPRELNAAIRRANPALGQANRTLRILDSERHMLGRLIDASDRVVGELARRHAAVADFVDHAASVSRTVAARRSDVDLAIRRLPPLLAELEPAAVDLTGLATDARPVVRALGAAAPPVRALLGDFDPLARATRPTLVKLSQLSITGRRAVRASLPVARLLDPVARLLPPTVRIARPLVDSLRDKHVIEALGAFVFYGGVSTARFDKVSHILPSYQIGGNSCQQYAEQPVAGCDAHFAAFGGGPKSGKASGARAHGGARTPSASAPGGGTGSGSGAAPHGGPPGSDSLDAIRRILQGLPPVAPPRGGGPVPGAPQQLLDFLLKP